MDNDIEGAVRLFAEKGPPREDGMFQLPTADQLREVMKSKGYAVFDGEKGYDLNLFGIRTSDRAANTFNDWVGAMYLQHGIWNLFCFPATTDPGLYWREHPMNVKGTAMLKPGQWRGCWQVGKHQGKYEALVQRKEVTVYRDPDRDNLAEAGEEDTGLFGINIHRANPNQASSQVDKWSAGCQVLADPLQFDFLMALAKKSTSLYGPSLSYTLLDEADFS